VHVKKAYIRVKLLFLLLSWRVYWRFVFTDEKLPEKKWLLFD
jgi:hypothetical protein